MQSTVYGNVFYGKCSMANALTRFCTFISMRASCITLVIHNYRFKSEINFSKYVENIIAFLNEYEVDNTSSSYLTECFENKTLARNIKYSDQYLDHLPEVN